MKSHVLAATLVLLLGCGHSPPSPSRPPSLSVQRRVALVIGNAAYRRLPLIPAGFNDAFDMAEVLRSLRFDDVRLKTDLGAKALREALEDFARTAVRQGDLALIYFSGHGGQAEGQSYILPVDYAQPASAGAVEAAGGYPISRLRDLLDNGPARVRVMIFDASRGAVITSSPSAGVGLGAITVRPEGSLIAYSAPAGAVAPFDRGRHGFYTAELIAELRGPVKDFASLLDEVQLKIERLTKGRQIPYLQGTIDPPLYLGDSPAVPATEQPERLSWATARRSGTVEAYQGYLRLFPKGLFADVATMKVAAGQKPAGIAQGDTTVNPIDGQQYASVPPGEISLDCGDEPNLCGERDRPAARIVFSKGFRIGATEVTVGAWKRFRQATGAAALPARDADGRQLNDASGNDLMPALAMTRDEARRFCKWIGGHLPKEEEWEYAARAGRPSLERNWEDAVWYAANSGARRLPSSELKSGSQGNYDTLLSGNRNGPHPVAQKLPNAWSLYDTLGNAWEWTEPRLPGGEAGLVRGGSWASTELDFSWSKRTWIDPSAREHDVGLRCVWDRTEKP